MITRHDCDCDRIRHRRLYQTNHQHSEHTGNIPCVRCPSSKKQISLRKFLYLFFSHDLSRNQEGMAATDAGMNLQTEA